MTGKELKKLSRGELLELLVEQGKRMQAVQAEAEAREQQLREAAEAREQALQEELAALREKLEDRTLKAAECGSIAEASLQVSGVFSAAQEAAEVYLNSVREHCAAAEAAESTRLAEAEARAARLVANAEEKAAEILARAEAQAAEKLAAAEDKLSNAGRIADELAREAALAAAKSYAQARREGPQKAAEN